MLFMVCNSILCYPCHTPDMSQRLPYVCRETPKKSGLASRFNLSHPARTGNVTVEATTNILKVSQAMRVCMGNKIDRHSRRSYL